MKLIKTKMLSNKDFYFSQTLKCCIYPAYKLLAFIIYDQNKFHAQLRLIWSEKSAQSLFMVVNAPEAFFFHFIFYYTFIVLLLVWQKMF